MKTKVLLSALLLFTLNAFAQNIPAYVPSNGLVGWWPFNGNANDESGNGNNGVVNGATLTPDRFGNVNSAYSFDGVNDYIIGNCDLFPNQERTVMVWFFSNNIGNGPSGRAILGYGGQSCGQSWIMTLDNAGSANGQNSYEVNSHCNFFSITSLYGQTPPVGRWHNWIVTTESNGTKFYLDGNLILNTNAFVNNTITTLRNFTFGCYTNTNGIGELLTDPNNTPWDGILDDIALWNRALTQQEISSLYTGQNAVVCNAGSILQNDTSICTGATVQLQAQANPAQGTSCFTPALKSAGNQNFNISAVTSDASGNIYHTGAYSGTVVIGNTTLNGIGGRDIFLVKYDSCGNQQWVIRGGSAANEDYAGGDFGKGLATDADGNVYMVGRYNQTCTIFGTGGTSFTAAYTVVGGNANHQDGFLVKISPAGAILWGATLRGGSNDGFNGVTVDPSGNPIVSGGFNGCCPSSFAGTIFGTTNSLNISSFGINYGTGVVAKFNSSGAVQWAARIYNRDASGGAIKTDAAGNIYVTSSFRSWNNGTAAQVYDGLNAVSGLFNPGIGLGYLLKLAPNGALQWGTTFGNNGDGVNTLTQGTGVDVDANGDVWVSGYYSGAAPTFYGTGGVNQSAPASSGNRGFIAKYNANGQALAVNTLQQTVNNNTIFYGLACSTGVVRAVGNYSGSNLGLNDIVWADYDLNAVQQTVSTAGGAGDDYAYDVRRYGAGYLISGSAASGSSIGGSTLASDGSFCWNTNGGSSSLPVSYVWSTGATTASINVSPTQTATYYVTVSNGISTCTDSVTVNVNAGSGNLFLQDTIGACGTSYTLEAGSGYTSYSWNTGATTQSISVTSSGWYRCNVTQGICTSTDSVFVSLVNADIVSNDTSICLGSQIQLSASGNCAGQSNGSPQWQLLISGSAYAGNETNFNSTGYNQATQTWYSVLRNGSVNRVYAFNLTNNTVTSLTSANPPGELYSYSFDQTNNRLVACRVGRDVVYALPLSGGTWQQIGSGGFDAESYSSNAFWNPVSNRFAYFGGYGFFATKNWIWENNGAGWINPYPNNNNCNPARRVGNRVASNAAGNKLYIFSGLGSCDGNQFASSCALGSPWPTDVGVYCWLKDLWELDLSTYQFTNVLPVNNQSINREGAFAFDYTSNAFYNIGGRAPTSAYGVYTPYTMDVARFRQGVDAGFTNFPVGGTPPSADRDGISVYDAIGNRILYARNDGIWAINLGGNCNLSYLWSTGAITASISVSPTQTTTYYCTVSNGISTCTDSVTVTVVPGSTAYYADNDNDNYGDSLLGYFCAPPAGGIAQGGDCDGTNPAINPGAAETCNGIDDDCDGAVDDGLAPVLGSISGPAVQCIPLGQGGAGFKLPSVAGASNYQWTVPVGMQVLTGQGTDSITVFWNLPPAHAGIVGPLSVTVTGACGQSTASVDVHLQISIPVRPSSISGAVRVCPGDTGIYSVYPVARARTYNWTMPAGMSIVSGAGSNIVTVAVGQGYTGGSIGVSAENACGIGAVRTKTVLLNTPATPTSISGMSTGLCGMGGMVYSVPLQPFTQAYQWTVPSGVTLLSGQGTNSITADISGAFGTGNLSVVAQNNCGSSAARILGLKGAPAQAGTISGPQNICPGAINQAYSVNTVAGATTYTWTAFSGVTIASGQGTKNITVNYPFATTTGQSISVVAGNACGNAAARSLSGINLSPGNCTRVAGSGAGITFYPNPAQDLVELRYEGDQPERIELYNMLGEKVYDSPWRNSITVSGLAAGLYLVRISGAGETQMLRMEVVR